MLNNLTTQSWYIFSKFVFYNYLIKHNFRELFISTYISFH